MIGVTALPVRKNRISGGSTRAIPTHRNHRCERRLHLLRKSIRDCGGHLLAKGTLHSTGALRRDRYASGCFSDPLGKKKERDRPALRAKRRRGVSDNHVSQMSAS